MVIEAKALTLSLEMLYQLFKTLNKSPSEKFEREWEKYKPELLRAIEEGDIETIGKIAAVFSDFC